MGQHALVTGAGRGLGRGVALALAQAGATLTVAARSAEELAELAAEIERAGGKANPVPTDVTDPAQVSELVAAARSHGPLSICVTCAGINQPGPATELAIEDFDAMIAVNLRGTWLVATEVAKGWLAVGSPGRIVLLSSQMGSVGYPGRAAYCASKHAVNGLTRALAVEWAPRGITVNAVAPTFVRTPLTAPMFADPSFEAEVLDRLPGREIAEIEDVVGAVTYLVGPQARMVNGHILAVDGGWTAW